MYKTPSERRGRAKRTALEARAGGKGHEACQSDEARSLDSADETDRFKAEVAAHKYVASLEDRNMGRLGKAHQNDTRTCTYWMASS